MKEALQKAKKLLLERKDRELSFRVQSATQFLSAENNEGNDLAEFMELEKKIKKETKQSKSIEKLSRNKKEMESKGSEWPEKKYLTEKIEGRLGGKERVGHTERDILSKSIKGMFAETNLLKDLIQANRNFDKSVPTIGLVGVLNKPKDEKVNKEKISKSLLQIEKDHQSEGKYAFEKYGFKTLDEKQKRYLPLEVIQYSQQKKSGAESKSNPFIRSPNSARSPNPATVEKKQVQKPSLAKKRRLREGSEEEKNIESKPVRSVDLRVVKTTDELVPKNDLLKKKRELSANMPVSEKLSKESSGANKTSKVQNLSKFMVKPIEVSKPTEATRGSQARLGRNRQADKEFREFQSIIDTGNQDRRSPVPGPRTEPRHLPIASEPTPEIARKLEKVRQFYFSEIENVRGL